MRDVPSVLVLRKLYVNVNRYVEMLRLARANFPPSAYDPPPGSALALSFNPEGDNVQLEGTCRTQCIQSKWRRCLRSG